MPLRDQPGIHFDSGLQDDSATDARFKITGEPTSAEKNRFDAAANTTHLDSGLIDDTPPNQGGFTLYPRSHRRLYDLALRVRAEGLEPGSDEARARLDDPVRRSTILLEVD